MAVQDNKNQQSSRKAAATRAKTAAVPAATDAATTGDGDDDESGEASSGDDDSDGPGPDPEPLPEPEPEPAPVPVDDTPRFSRERILGAEGGQISGGVARPVIVGALQDTDATDFTKDELKDAIDAFLERPVETDAAADTGDIFDGTPNDSGLEPQEA